MFSPAHLQGKGFDLCNRKFNDINLMKLLSHLKVATLSATTYSTRAQITKKFNMMQMEKILMV